MGKTSDTLHVKNRALYLPISKDLSSSITPIMKVSVKEQVKVAPLSEMEIMGKVTPATAGRTWMTGGRPQEHGAVIIARALIQPEACSSPLGVLNPREEEVTFPKGAVVAELESVADKKQALPQCQRKGLQNPVHSIVETCGTF